MADYPVNDTAYSAENLCRELHGCAKARSLGWENFDEYCSGNYVACPNRALNSVLGFDVANVVTSAIFGHEDRYVSNGNGGSL